MAIDPNKSHAFLSYTREDDSDFFRGGISWLREELENSVKAHTGLPFQIFQDVEDIQPGDRWANKLDQALEAAQLFIPILTPSFFVSEFCRREAKAFLDYEAKAGRDDLILPLYLIRTSALENPVLRKEDEIADALRERQHDDWRSLTVALRHEDTRWQAADKIVKLAETIAEIVERDVPVQIAVEKPERPEAPTASKGNAIPSQPTESNEVGALAEELRATKAELAELAKIQEEERLDWQAKEAERRKSAQKAIADAHREHQAEPEKQRELASEKRDLEDRLEESREAFRAKQTNEAKPSIAKARFLTMATLFAAIVAGGGAMYLMVLDDVKRLTIELDQARDEHSAALAASQERLAEIGRLTSELEQARTQFETAEAIIAADRTTSNDDTLSRKRSINDLEAGDTFRDCDDVCPEMIVIPAGEFLMGSSEYEVGRADNEGPQHLVTFSKPFAICRSEVTFAEWDACVADSGCTQEPDDEGWGRVDRPVVNVTWVDAQRYLVWLSLKTGADYRLPSEAEWEYAARAGTDTRYTYGDDLKEYQANIRRSNDMTVEIRSYRANNFGLFDVHGNVSEWVADRYHRTYEGAPNDGGAWLTGVDPRGVLRGGSWFDKGDRFLRSASRFAQLPETKNWSSGFRCARTLTSKTK